MRRRNNNLDYLPFKDENDVTTGGGTASVALSWKTGCLIFMCFLLFSMVFIGITLSLTISSPEARIIIPTMEPTPLPTTGPNTTVASTVPATSSTVFTSTVITTTPTPALLITCPPNVTIWLGSSLEVPNTGPQANASGGCQGVLIVEYVDEVVSSFSTSVAKRRRLKAIPPSVHSASPSAAASRQRRGKGLHPPPLAAAERRPVGELRGEVIDLADMISMDQKPELHSSPPTEARKLRSPSFSSPNYILQGTPLTFPTLNISTNAQVAANNVAVVMYNHEGTVFVMDKNTSIQSTFNTQELPGFGTECSSIFTNHTFSENQVIWDEDAQRWLFFQRVFSNVSAICVHISSANETNPALSLYTTYRYEMPVASQLHAGLWTRAYTLSFFSETNVSKLCVLDRSAVLVSPIANVTPPMFCAHSFDNNAPHAWVPVDSQYGPRPPLATENSNSPNVQLPGALFMRAVDDEFYRNGSSPTVDQIEVEHWYNINFTTGAYNSLRYPMLFPDYNDSPTAGNCSGIYPECIDTPVLSQRLNVDRYLRKANYRMRGDGIQSIVTSLTSHSGKRIYWIEMRWRKPNIATPERWDVAQANYLTPIVSHGFSSNVQMDVNGTILLSFEGSSNTTYPSVFIASRLANDPENYLRNETILFSGSIGSLFSAGPVWSTANSIAIDTQSARTFFVAGLVSRMLPQAANVKVGRVRILGEVIQRVWSVTDVCGTNVTCSQWITTV